MRRSLLGPAAVAVCALLTLACFTSWKLGERHGSEKTYDLMRADQVRDNERWAHLVDLYANQGFPPGALEWTASKPLTFTINGRPLHCVGLLNKLGDVRSISCDWETWRNGKDRRRRSA